VPAAATRICAVAVAAALLTGCYGSKLVKGPINSEHASLQADSIRAETRELLTRVGSLEEALAEERLASSRSQARMGATISELEESVRILISRLDDQAQTQSSRRPPPRTRVIEPDSAGADSTAVDRAGGSEEELYRAAYLDVTRGNYDLAIRGFQNYLVRHPTGTYLPEVHYYLGECYYAESEFLEAVPEFRYVVDRFPASRLVPAAYLKSGRCYQELEEKNLAERAFQTLIDKHPDSAEAQQARAALDELEG